jgi:hypothetical protein
MATEECSVCGNTVQFDSTVHVLVNTKSDRGVMDHYVCRRCYETDLAPLFPD